MKRLGEMILVSLVLAFFIVGCGDVGSTGNKEAGASGDITVEDHNVTSKLYFDIPVNILESAFAEHTFSLYLDEECIHEFTNSDYFTLLCDVEKGEHSISFMVDDNAVSDGQYSFTVDNDKCISFTIDYQEEFSIGEIKESDSIADSAITVSDMSGIALDEAMSKLADMHFVNVQYEANDSSSILDTADWIVESQSVSAGEVVDKTEKIVLSCRKVYFQFYIDLEFDQNLILATYDVDAYLDGEMISTIPHGKSFTHMTKLKEGDHKIVFYKNTNHEVSAEKNISIASDSTLNGRLHTNGGSIELNDFVVNNSIANTSFEVANVVGMNLEAALSTLSNIGFTNLVREPETDIWVNYNWIVVKQSVDPGTTVDKNEEIKLSCVKRVDYLTQNYLKLNIVEAKKFADEHNNTISYVDYLSNAYMTNKVDSMSTEEKQKWTVKQASFDDNDNILLYFVYAGNVEMPDVTSKTLDEALSILKNKGFSGIETVTDDQSVIWDNSDWKVIKQSVEAGKQVNANGKITLTVTSNSNNDSISEHSNADNGSETNNDDLEISYTTNDKSTYKNGNKGVYAYSSIGGAYDRYYIIDLDEGFVYDFSEGNGEETCTKGTIKSGNLNTVLIVTYYDGDDSWESGFHFKYKNQPDQLMLQLSPDTDWEVEFYPTNLRKALELRDTKRITDFRN